MNKIISIIINKNAQHLNRHGYYKLPKEHILIKRAGHKFSILNEIHFFNYFYPNCTHFDFWDSVDEKTTHIQHRTSLQKALSILKMKKIFGCDANQGAHFETPLGSFNNSDANGVTMFFKWHGAQKCVSGNCRENNPNMLYHVAFNDWEFTKDSNNKYWESRLYPGTNKGLEFIGIRIDSKKVYYAVQESLEVEVVKCIKDIWWGMSNRI